MSCTGGKCHMTEHENPRQAEPPGASPPAGPPSGDLTPAVYRLGIGSISDVVFGLALSIGSLILVSQTPSTGDALALGIFYFGFSFFIVILVWLGFRRITVVLPYETQATLTVNVALLFCVAIEPFLFYVMVTTNVIGADATMAFAIDLGVMMSLLSALGYLLLQEEKGNAHRRIARAAIDRIDRSTIYHMVVGGIFLVSALPVFWTISFSGGPIRYDIWYFGLVWIFAVQARSAVSLRARVPKGSLDSLVTPRQPSGTEAR